MKVSINTAVFLKQLNQGISQYDCLKKLSGYSIENIEVRGEFFKDKTRDTELYKIVELCEKNCWKLYFSVPEELFMNGKLNDNIFSYINMAHQFNFEGLKISLGSFSNLSDINIYRLTNIIKKSHVKLTVENQPNKNGKLDIFYKNLTYLLEQIPDLGYTFDIGNWYWTNDSPTIAFRKLKKYINIIHLKDIRDQTTVMLGEGETDWKNIIISLNNNIPIFLEYEISLENINEEINKINSI